ncbi:MAG: hypothetical protein PF517_18000 [Salinivirgaceae bacterium]|nr:hypothetical protein [Salinivirgaceae bacterium]
MNKSKVAFASIEVFLPEYIITNKKLHTMINTTNEYTNINTYIL